MIFEIIGRWRVPLVSIFYGKIGRKQGFYVYAVLDDNKPIYVGKTTTAIYARLCKHMQKDSPLGYWLYTEQPTKYKGIDIEVHSVIGDLGEAEKFFIQTMNPLLNIQHQTIDTYQEWRFLHSV